MQGFWKELSEPAEHPAPFSSAAVGKPRLGALLTPAKSNSPRPISASVADQAGGAMIHNLAWLTSELDQTGLAQLYERYGYLVYRRSLAMLQNREDAEDALQEV